MHIRRCLKVTLGLAFLVAASSPGATAEAAFHVKTTHPRLIVENVKAMAERCAGPLADDYRVVKERADQAVRRGGVEFITNAWAIPEDLMNCGLAYLVEREAGREHQKYAEVIKRQWGDGGIISNREGSHFGYHAIAYDWIHDALDPGERERWGGALGGWLRFFTGKPEILLKWGHWEYNQTWGPIHFDIMNSRDAIAPKLLVALAILGDRTPAEEDARSFLDSWSRRVPEECLPAFDRMGGVWSESYGHGAYGPVTVIPYAFRAWRTATGIDLLASLHPWGFPVESPRWIAYTCMPHDGRTAWIDDGDGSRPAAFARAAPMLSDGLSRWFSDRGRDWLRERWQRVACLDPSIEPVPPSRLPLAYLFPGAGHVYMRSAWDDPDATWAFFGCGPQFAGHSRDDEGHFLIYKKGALVSRQGGQGHNDDDFYAGGSLIYNVVTIYDPSGEVPAGQGERERRRTPAPRLRGRSLPPGARRDRRLREHGRLHLRGGGHHPWLQPREGPGGDAPAPLPPRRPRVLRGLRPRGGRPPRAAAPLLPPRADRAAGERESSRVAEPARG